MIFDPRVFQVAPSSPDARDWIYGTKNTQIRPAVLLTEWDSVMEDQGELGSCAAAAITSAYELLVKKQYPSDFTDLSKLFLYYNTRKIESTVALDLGVFQLRNAFRSIKCWGLCAESIWPYDISKFDSRPSDDSYQEALGRNLESYTRLFSVQDILENINAERPVVLGLEIFTNFGLLDALNPVVPVPSETDWSLGGHAMTALGYSLDRRQFYVKNSYGDTWGAAGYCSIPFEYIEKYGFEHWTFEISPQLAPDSAVTHQLVCDFFW
jgi:C1A family cysteine protease